MKIQIADDFEVVVPLGKALDDNFCSLIALVEVELCKEYGQLSNKSKPLLKMTANAFR